MSDNEEREEQDSGGNNSWEEKAKDAGFISKDEVAALVASAVEKETRSLKAKRDELLGKIADPDKKAKRDLGEKLQALLDRSGLQSYDNLELLLEKAKNPDTPDEVLEIRRELTTTSTTLSKKEEELASLHAELEDIGGFVHHLLTNVELRDLFMNEGLSKVQAEFMTPKLLSKAKFSVIRDDESGLRKAVTENGLSPAEFFAGWLETEEAKEVMPQRRNSGFQSNGGSARKGSQQNAAKEYADAVASGNTLAAVKAARRMKP